MTRRLADTAIEQSELYQAAKRDAEEAEAYAAELEVKLAKAVDALGLLDKAAGETARMGAATGAHWTRLTIALLKSRTTLAELSGPMKGEKDV
jgi:hypothetical protein